MKRKSYLKFRFLYAYKSSDTDKSCYLHQIYFVQDISIIFFELNNARKPKILSWQHIYLSKITETISWRAMENYW